MIYKKLIIFGIVMIAFIYVVHGTCTLNLDAENYTVGATATITMICDKTAEENLPYSINISNSTNFLKTNITGTTPAIKDTYFYQSYLFNITGWPNNATVNVSLVGENLEGKDSAFVRTSGAIGEGMIITSFSITDEYYIGKYGAIRFYVETEGGNEISNAQCIIDIVNGDNLPIISSGKVTPSQGSGLVLYSQFLSDDTFDKGKSYLWDIACTCFNTSVGTSFNQPGFCMNELTGIYINDFSHIETQYPFTITDLADKMNWTKQRNLTHEGLWVENQYGKRANMTPSVALLYQEGINWSKYDNEVDGKAFLIAGEQFKICGYYNNTFDDKQHIIMNHLSILRQPGTEIRPLFFDWSKMTHLDEEELMHIEIQSHSVTGLDYIKCSDWFRLPKHIKGQNNYKFNFHLMVEGYEQEIIVDSDRFTVFGEKSNETSISLFDITNITSTLSGLSQESCQDITYTTTYDFFGESSETQYLMIGCTEDIVNDIYLHCTELDINPDIGSNNNGSFQAILPYVSSDTEAELDVWVYKELDGDRILVDFFSGDWGGVQGFNITVNSSDSCKYQQEGIQSKDDIIYLQWLQSQGLDYITRNQTKVQYELKNQSVYLWNQTIVNRYLEYLVNLTKLTEEAKNQSTHLRNISLFIGNQSDAIWKSSLENKNQSTFLWEISNKTGTFYFDITTADISRGSRLTVSVNAQRELGIGTLEGHFICYVDGWRNETEDKWTHAVNETHEYITSRSLNTRNLPMGTYTVICKIGLTSFTNLKHTATKTFIVQSGHAGAGHGSGSGASVPIDIGKCLSNADCDYGFFCNANGFCTKVICDTGYKLSEDGHLCISIVSYIDIIDKFKKHPIVMIITVSLLISLIFRRRKEEDEEDKE